MGEEGEEQSDHFAEGDDVVDQFVVGRGGDAVVGVEAVFHFMEAGEDGEVIEENDVWSAGDHPSAVLGSEAHVLQGFDGLSDGADEGCGFEFDLGAGVVVWADEAVAVAPAADGAGDFGA